MLLPTYKNSFVLSRFVVEHNKPTTEVEKRLLDYIQDSHDATTISQIEREVREKLDMWANGHATKLMFIGDLQFTHDVDRRGEFVSVHRMVNKLSTDSKNLRIEEPLGFSKKDILKIYSLPKGVKIDNHDNNTF